MVVIKFPNQNYVFEFLLNIIVMVTGNGSVSTINISFSETDFIYINMFMHEIINEIKASDFGIMTDKECFLKINIVSNDLGTISI